MTKINCAVEQCSHNKQGVCYANCVDIVGSSAIDDFDTACGAFLNKLHYSELTNNTLGHGACNCLTCSVETCVFNENNLCALHDIEVTGRAAEYTQTQCSSFKLHR
jgi:hypothetical protein